MKYLLLFLFSFTFFLACDSNSGRQKRDALKRVEMVQRTPDWSTEEKGIQAIPDGDYIYMEWYLAAESPYFKEYRLERTSHINEISFEPISFETIASLEYFDTTYTDSIAIELNTTYFYRVSVLNVDDNYSEYSDTVFFQLGPKPTVFTTIEKTDTTLDVIFSIDLNNELIPEPVYLRIFDGDDKILIALLDQEPFYNSPSTTGKADFKFSAIQDFESGKFTSSRTDLNEPDKIKLSQGKVYQVRVDYKGPLNNPQKNGHSGAKSRWQLFRYQP